MIEAMRGLVCVLNQCLQTIFGCCPCLEIECTTLFYQRGTRINAAMIQDAKAAATLEKPTSSTSFLIGISNSDWNRTIKPK